MITELKPRTVRQKNYLSENEEKNYRAIIAQQQVNLEKQSWAIFRNFLYHAQIPQVEVWKFWIEQQATKVIGEREENKVA